ncbi:MAG: hypothetical protein HFG59_10200 [Lachnospiraceae bacterium]|nr:hypothetical protein [Lachnospiraceae bacterium]
MNRSQPLPFPYEDILYLPHPVSSAHPPMPLSDRAAQFAPFAALASYHEAVREEARFTSERIELDEHAKDLLDKKFRLLQQHAHLHPQVTLLYFLPDKEKAGGTYVSAAGFLKKTDWCRRMVILQDGTAIPIDDIIELSGAIFT